MAYDEDDENERLKYSSPKIEPEDSIDDADEFTPLEIVQIDQLRDEFAILAENRTLADLIQAGAPLQASYGVAAGLFLRVVQRVISVEDLFVIAIAWGIYLGEKGETKLFPKSQ